MVRGVLTIIFSLLLLAGQFTAQLQGAEERADSKASCACSHCERTCCIQRDSPASSESQPAVPVSSTQQNAWQLLLPKLVVFLLLDRQADAPPVPVSVAFSFVPAVPLYDRNCSYLI